MKTAVEWHYDQLKEIDFKLHSGLINYEQCKVLMLETLEQAKKMEKEQIEDAWDDGYEKGSRDRIEKISNPVGDAKQYYNETFKSE